MTSPTPRSSRLQGDRGSATAETAIVLPVVVLMILVLAVVGVAASQQVRVDSAARAAARELARGEDEAAAIAAAQRTSGPDALVEITREGPWVRVDVTRRMRTDRGGLVSGAVIVVHGSASARLEPQLVDGSS